MSPGLLPDAIWTWGSTEEERAAAYPCDGLLPDHHAALFRAVSVHAPPQTVFGWLCQLRAAPYSYDWIDNWGRRSPRRRDPDLQRLAVGQTFMSIFKLVDFELDRHITLLHNGVFGQVAGTYAVVEGQPTRLVVKLLWSYPRGFRARPLRAILPTGDFVMMRKQLRTLARLAEAG